MSFLSNSASDFHSRPVRPHARGSKTILDSMSWIPDSRHTIPGSLSVEPGFRIAIVSGLRSLLIQDSKAQDPGFHSKNLLDSGFHDLFGFLYMGRAGGQYTTLKRPIMHIEGHHIASIFVILDIIWKPNSLVTEGFIIHSKYIPELPRRLFAWGLYVPFVQSSN